jgi:hypothetical protein
MASYLDILRPQVLTQVVRQVVASADPILNFMGFQPGGSNEKYMGHGREGAFHVFDDSRKVGKGRAPGTPAARSSKQPMKQIPFVYPRMHDSVSLLAEFYHNLGRIDDPAMRDEAGKDMITRQTGVLSQKAANWRIAMTVGMLRDQLYVHQEGDDWFVNYTSGSALFQMNCRVPAGNKNQLLMLDRSGGTILGTIIDVPWSNAGANIPLHIAKINQARAVLGVGPVTDVHLNSVTWQYLITNDYLAAMAGIANPPFENFAREAGKRPDGSPMHEYIGRFNALPGVTFHISDEGLELWSATTDTYVHTKHWADGMVVMMGDPKARSDNYTLYQGSEPIAEYDGGPETVRVGLSSWSKKTANPTATEIYVLDNALPVNHDPYSICIATVAGF